MENRHNGITRASLLPLPAAKHSKSIPLAIGETTIGRAPSNTVQLTHGGVSRAHAVISFNNGQFILSDLQSKNGTFVNNRRIQQVALQHSDNILFGERGFLFSIESDSAAAAAPEADIMSTFGDTMTINPEHLELSKLLTHNAESAISNFFKLGRTEDDASRQMHQAHKRLSLLYQLSEGLRTTREPEEVLEKGLELLFEALPFAKRAAAMLRSETSETLEVRAVNYRDPDPDPDTAVIPVSRNVLQQVVDERVAIVSQDAKGDARFADTEAFVADDINSFVCVPLIQQHNRVIGAVYLDTDDNLKPFTQIDMEFTAAVANELALSVHNCRLQRDAIRNEKVNAIGMAVTHLSHNIKNLLTLNRSAADMMDEQLSASDDESLQKNWQLVRTALDRIADLTGEMLDYTQSSVVAVQPIYINAAVSAECEMIKESLNSEGIELELQLAPDLPKWEMNESLLQRAIHNLVVNAKDALKETENGRIRISTGLDDSSRLFIRVEDNGCGIGKGFLTDIFDLFYTTKGIDGSGVGLSMIQKFVESMGGTVSVVSQIGIGSVFTLLFPGSGDDRLARPSQDS